MQHLEAMVALRGEIIYPRGVFQRSRSRLVNFWPTRRVPPSPPFPLLSSRRRFSGSEKHAKARRSFRENNFIIFGRNLSDLASIGSATRGREFQRPLITLKSRCRVVVMVVDRLLLSPRFALCHRAKLLNCSLN